jgi:proline iminopeptidase
MQEADGDDRETVVKHRVERGKMTTGERFPIPEETIRRREQRAYDRCFHRAGRDRQHAALVATGDRSDRLRTINVPVLVIHGVEDPLVHYSAGVDTVRKIPHARLELIEGMGHDLPEEVFPELAATIAKHAELALCL